MKKEQNQRRNFMKKSIALSSTGLLSSTLLKAENFETMEKQITDTNIRPKVLFFDVNETLLDLAPLKASVNQVLQGNKELLQLWFTTMLQYSLVNTVANKYNNFGEIGAAALMMTAKNNGIEITEEEAKKAIVPIRSLPPHPEVKAALQLLKQQGFTLVSLTNSPPQVVEAQFTNSGIIDLFDEMLTVEEIGKYKPHADTYNWAIRKVGVLPEESMLIAAHGWDVAGAAWAGWRTAFISRPGQQLYPLAPRPELMEDDLSIIAKKLIALVE